MHEIAEWGGDKMIKVFRQYYPIRNIIFVISESVFIFLSIFAAVNFFDPAISFGNLNYIFLSILIATFICQICIYYTDLYEMKNSMNIKMLGARLFKAVIMASIFLGILYFVFPWLMIKYETFAFGFILMMIMIGLTRYCYSLVLELGLFNQRIILIGAGDLAKKIFDEIQERVDCGYEISYIVLNKSSNKSLFQTKIPFIQPTDYLGLCEIAKEEGIRTIVVAIEEKRGNFPSEELLKCRIEGVEVLDGNSFYEMLSGKLVVNQLYPSWLIFSTGFRKSIINKILKRTFDILLSLVMLIMFLPLMVLVAILIKIDSKGSIFYSQQRVGQYHKTYNIYKFRSMIENAEETNGPQYAVEDDPRITRIGYFLRKLRIDEMPQLWNVLKGEMSFVGPRPERNFFVEDYEKLIPYYVERFSVKPGITGWAQICYQYGSNAAETIEKLNYDLFYIKNMSILMDILIVFRTVKIVIFGKGAR
jgi:sugar transferase (PEP-CTERM system associated)